jgi:hypothetical protein
VKGKPQASAARARLQVVAADDARKLRALVAEMLESRQRLDREAALESLVDRPIPELRPQLRDLYFDLDATGLKQDQGARMRISIVKVLRAIGDARDADIGVRAADTVEKPFGEDSAWELRAHGLMLLAELAPDAFPYYAIEHLNDMSGPEESEPAGTAVQLLAGTANHVALYQWLRANQGTATAAAAFEVFAEEAPREIVQRYVTGALAAAVKTDDEAMATVLVESIVRRELDGCYPAIAELMFAKVSDELYAYVAMVLAGTNRAALLSLLEDQLHRGRRPKLIEAALRVRATPEQEAILKRWEDG